MKIKTAIVIAALCSTMNMAAQTETTTQAQRVAELQAEAAAKAKAAQEAALAAQEAARAAQEAADAAAQEALKMEQQAPVEPLQEPKEAQSGWTVAKENVKIAEEKDKAETEAAEAKINAKLQYLEAGAVPEVDGRVQWKHERDIAGMTAQQIYDAMLSFLSRMTKEPNQLERSQVVMVNENEHKIVATFQEWLTFTSNAVMLDRAKFNYILQVNCSDGHLEVLLDHVQYQYGTGKDAQNYKAEEWITDKYAVNKKHTRMFPISGKFRRKTIDRKNEIFNNIDKAF